MRALPTVAGPGEPGTSAVPAKKEKKQKKDKKAKSKDDSPRPGRTAAAPDGGAAKNRFYDDQEESLAIPAVEATPAALSEEDRRIVRWQAPVEPAAGAVDEGALRVWDGRLQAPPAPKDIVMVGKAKKNNPAGFAKGAAVSMAEMPQFFNTGKKAIKTFSATQPEAKAAITGNCLGLMPLLAACDSQEAGVL